MLQDVWIILYRGEVESTPQCFTGTKKPKAFGINQVAKKECYLKCKLEKFTRSIKNAILSDSGMLFLSSFSGWSLKIISNFNFKTIL